MADSMAPWAAPGPGAPPTRPPGFGAGAVSGGAPGAVRTLPAGAPPEPAPAKAARRSGTRPIPLRPLSVLEVIDAGVGSLRSSPRRVHLLALAAGLGFSLAGYGGSYLLDHAVDDAVSHHSYTTTDFFGNTIVYEGVASGATSFGRVLTSVLFAIVCSGVAAAFAAGLYAVSAQRYVDGRPPDPAAARDGYRGRLGRTAWLTFLVSIPRLAMLGLSVFITLYSANNPNGDASTDFVWLILIGVPVCALCTGLFAVAVPALMLERVKVGKAIQRSRRLAVGGIWRSGWTCFFTLLMTYSPLLLLLAYEWVSEQSDGASSPITILDVVLGALIVVASIPLRATTATMLYVDRRFRREGLDVRIAWARVAKETL